MSSGLAKIFGLTKSIYCRHNLNKWAHHSQCCLPKRHLRLYREKTIRAMYWRARSFDLLKLPPSKRSDFQEWNYRSEIYAFSRRLQENLAEETLRKVFTDPSYALSIKTEQAKLDLPTVNVEPNSALIENSHRLLHDSIKPYLRFHFDQVPEDGIDSIYRFLTSDVVMADIAKWIGCRELILATEYPPTQAMMANSVRAFVAGIDADLGFKRVQRFVVDMIISYLNDLDILDDVWHIENPKDTLNQILKNSDLPSYEPRLMFQTGIKTVESCHIVGLYVDQKFLGSSPGETIAIAEECAALDVFRRMFDLGLARRPFVYGEESEKIDYDAFKKEHVLLKDWTIKS